MLNHEQILKEHSTLVQSLSFHIQNVALRTEALAFVETNKNRLLAAPASSALSKHHAYAGGLLQHINQNIHLGLIFLQDMLTFSKLPASTQYQEDLVLTALLHDIHKIGDPFGRLYYEPNMIKASRKKDETQMVQSTANPYAINEYAYKTGKAVTFEGDTIVKAAAVLLDRNLDALPQGELSLMYVNSTQPTFYSLLNDSVLFAVRYHDVAYQSWAKFVIAVKETPVMLSHHHADMVSSWHNRWLNQPVETEE